MGALLCRGKIKSLQDASATTAGHVELLLGDVAAVCGSKAAGSADDVKGQAEKLQKVGDGGCFTCLHACCLQKCAAWPLLVNRFARQRLTLLALGKH
jgi:hypothetical protein